MKILPSRIKLVNPYLSNYITSFEDLIKIQSSDGNWNYDPYMHGLANGLILGLSLLTGEDPQFLTAPDKWLCDRKEQSSVSFYRDYTNLYKRCTALSSEDKNLVNTLAKCYPIFKRLGIIGFKTPKMSSGKEKQKVKCCTIKGKKYIYILRINTKEDKIQFQLFTPGSENYSYDKVTRITTDIKNFLSQLLKIKDLIKYHSKIKLELERIDKNVKKDQ
jgi:hypothetical protein